MKSADIPDVCVIGAGLAGGLVAYELARRGVRVVVLEAGPRFDPADRFAAFERLMTNGTNPWRPDRERDRFTNGGRIAYPLNEFRAKGIGGTTLHWTALAARLHESDFQVKRRFGLADDWPIAYDTLEPYYGLADRALGVAGTEDNPFASRRSAPYPFPPFPFSHSDVIVQTGCERAGVTLHHPAFARRQVATADGLACQAFGVCGSHQICPVSAQYTAERHIGLAEATGRAQVVPEAVVRRIDLGGRDRVERVRYITTDGVEHEQRANVFVLAAHAVESARLLLLSASNRCPDGLANGSGLVGRHLMEHPWCAVHGRIGRRVYPFRIGFHTAESHQFAAPENRADRGAFRLAVGNSIGPQPEDLAGEAADWGAPLEREIAETFGHHIGLQAFVEQLPDPNNRVTLDPIVRDRFGDPVPRLTFDIGEWERHTARGAVDVMTNVLDRLGAVDIQEPFGDGFAFCGHQMGTCRMGSNPSHSVVDPQLRSHEVRNLFIVGSSVFVTAGALNPSLTIAALAIRLSDALVSAG